MPVPRIPLAAFVAILVSLTPVFAQQQRSTTDAGEKQWKWTPELVIPKMPKAPAIDGNINAPEWQTAAEVGQLKVESEGVGDQFERRFWVGYDDKNFYLAFTLQRPANSISPGMPSKEGRLEVGSSGPSADTVEIMFAPELNFKKGYSFWMYGNSAFGDAFLTPNKEYSFNPEWQKVAKLTDKGWAGEMAIPWEAFGLKGPPPQDQWWGFDFVDARRGPFRLLAHFSHRGKWQTYSNFGRVRFAPVPAVRFVHAGELPDGKIGLEFQVVNATGTDEKLKTSLELLRRKDGDDGGPASYYANIDSGVSEGEQNEFAKNSTLSGMIDFAESFYVPLTELPAKTAEITASKDAVAFGTEGKLPYGEYLARYRVETAKGEVLAAGTSVFRNDPPLALRVEPYWLYSEVLDVFSDLRKTKLSGPGQLVIDVLPPDGKGRPVATTSAEVNGDSPAAQTQVPIHGVKPGKYLLQVVLKDAQGKELAKNSMAIERPETPDWYKSDAGNKVLVPDPWTPIQADGKGIVTVWGRTYDLSNVFPSSVTSNGRQVLASPVQLKAVSAAGPIALKVDKIALKEKNDASATYDVSMSGGGLSLTGTMTAEFDGLVWYDLKLASTGDAVALNSLTLDVPIQASLAELVDHHQFMEDAILNKGKSPAPDQNGANGLLQDAKMPFTPFLWVGNEKAGIAFVGEAPIDWSVAKPFSLLETRMSVDGKPAQILANIVQAPKTLDKPMRLQFGLQATPIRDFPKDRSLLNIYQRTGVVTDEAEFKKVADAGGKVFVFYYNWRGNSTTELGGTPERPVDAKQREDIKKGIELAHKYGLKVLLYTGWGINAVSPNWKKFSYELGRYPIVNNGWGTFGQSASLGGGYVDYMAYHHADLAKEYGADGVLWDSAAQVPTDANPHTGNAWIDDKGNVRPIFPVRATRELFRRVYTIYHGEVIKDGVVYNHAGSMWPVNVYSTYLNRGEGRPMTAKTLKESWIPFEEFRSSYSGEPYGTLYSGEVNDWAKLPMRVSTHLTVTLLHGTYAKEYALKGPEFFRSYGYEDRPLLQLWNTFGWLPMDGTETKMYYYDNAAGKYQAVKATPASLLSSAFVSGDKKRAIVVVSNMDTTPVKGAVVDLSPAQFGFPADAKLKVEDGVTLEPIELKGNQATVDIDQQRYRVFKISVL